MTKRVLGVMAVTVMLSAVAGAAGVGLSEIKGRMAYRRGDAYRYGKGVERDLEKSFKFYAESALAGYPEGEFMCGLCYWNGEGVGKNMVEAVGWKKLAALGGHPRAMFDMGVARHFGYGGVTNCYEACQWFRMAAQNGYGDPDFVPNVEEYEGCGPEVSAQWILSAADAGYSNAMRWFAHAMIAGRGVSRNDAIAVEWFEAASESGSELSTYILGDMKCKGRIPGGRKEGHDLIERAAEANCIFALKKLNKL